MDRKVGLQLLAALLAEKNVGTDGVGDERNSHFMGALRVAFPDIPNGYIFRRNEIPMKRDGTNRDAALAIHKFAAVLNEWAASLTDSGEALDGKIKP